MLQHRSQFSELYGMMKETDVAQITESGDPILIEQYEAALSVEYDCYKSFDTGHFFRDILKQYPPRILLGTRWPILTALSARNLFNSILGHTFWVNEEKNCLHVPKENQIKAHFFKLCI